MTPTFCVRRHVVGRSPLVAYDTDYDLEKVLKPEARLGIAPIGNKGFCALRLAQRLLDPVPAGKLQAANASAILSAA